MKAYQLLEHPESWTQAALAKNQYNHEVKYDSPEAVKWCIRGALNKCYRDVYKLLRNLTILENHLHTTVPEFNDSLSTTHKDVIDLLTTWDI